MACLQSLSRLQSGFSLTWSCSWRGQSSLLQALPRTGSFSGPTLQESKCKWEGDRQTSSGPSLRWKTPARKAARRLKPNSEHLRATHGYDWICINNMLHLKKNAAWLWGFSGCSIACPPSKNWSIIVPILSAKPLSFSSIWDRSPLLSWLNAPINSQGLSDALMRYKFSVLPTSNSYSSP